MSDLIFAVLRESGSFKYRVACSANMRTIYRIFMTFDFKSRQILKIVSLAYDLRA